MRRMKHVARPISLGLVLGCVVMTMAIGTGPSIPAPEGTSTTAGNTGCCATRISCRCSARNSSSTAVCPSSTVAPPSQNNCDEYPVAHDVPHARRCMVLRAALAALLLHERQLLLLFAMATAACLWLLAGSPGVVVRARPDAVAVRHDQLGPGRGCAVQPRTRRVVARPRRLGRCPHRPGRGDEVLSRVLPDPAVPAGPPRPRARSFDPCPVVVGRHLGGRQPPVRARRLPARGGSSSGSTALGRPTSIQPLYIACRYADGLCISISNANLVALTGFLVGSFVAIFWKIAPRSGLPQVGGWGSAPDLFPAWRARSTRRNTRYGSCRGSRSRCRGFAGSSRLRSLTSPCSSRGSGSSRTYTGTWHLLPQWWFEVAVGVRALVLLWCLVGWVRDEIPDRGLVRVPRVVGPSAATAPALA